MDRILLIEDDLEIIELLNINLSRISFQLISAVSGKKGIQEFNEGIFDLVILDIMLPDMDGIEICKIIRQKDSRIPLMMLTARSEELDKVLALELGADDYITKPFGIKELIARVKALIRRRDIQPKSHKKVLRIVKVQDLEIDPFLRKVILKGERVELTPKEFELLNLLAENPGKSFSREDLLKEIWGYTFQGYQHTVTAHINRLRIKIESEISNPKYILTSWGIGYRFCE